MSGSIRCIKSVLQQRQEDVMMFGVKGEDLEDVCMRIQEIGLV